MLDGLVIAVATPTPTPTLQVDPDLVTPGVWGFVAVVFIAVALVFLVGDMNRRIRRGRVRADLADELKAEKQRHDGAESDDVASGRESSEPDARSERPDGN